MGWNEPRLSRLNILITDLLFKTLNQSERQIVEEADTVLRDYIKKKEITMHKLLNLWEDHWKSLKLDEDPINDLGRLWTFVVTFSSDASDWILKLDYLERKTKEKIVESVKEITLEFKDTSEFKNYEDARNNVLPKFDNLITFFEKWSESKSLLYTLRIRR